MVLERFGDPLRRRELPVPEPAREQVLLRVHTCGVCRTDLHLLDGEVGAALPRVLGHQIVATVVGQGPPATRLTEGMRVGVPWLAWTCGACRFCRSGRENLCDRAHFTGCDVDGGYAEYTIADERFCLAIPDGFADLHAAPLLCAGLIGHRALGMTGDATTLGLYGFGASAHIVIQEAVAQGRRVHALTRPGDDAGQRLARRLGATWAGDSTQRPPEPLEAAIIFAPVGELVPVALRATTKGATVVCAGIHMSDIPSFPYELLWGERSVRSVANLTREDGEQFLALAPTIPIRTEVTTYPLEAANDALADLRRGRFDGAAVLQVISSSGEG